jgi:hypothetical protein
MKRLILLALAVLSLTACRTRCCPNALLREEAASSRPPSETTESLPVKRLRISEMTDKMIISGDNLAAQAVAPGETVFTGDSLSMRWGNVTVWAEEMRFKSDGVDPRPRFVTLTGSVRVEHRKAASEGGQGTTLGEPKVKAVR